LYKIIGFFLLSSFVIGCATGNRVKSIWKDNRKDEVPRESFLRYVVKQNISDSSFFIEKALYSISTKNFDQSGNATIKFKPPDKYLISLKTIGGIEVVRIMLTGDSILINNRIERNYMFGSQEFIKRVYGISTDFLPLIFGDILVFNKKIEKDLDCKEGSSVFKILEGTALLEYSVNCDLHKTEETNILLGTVIGKKVSLKFQDYKKIGEKYVPEKIELKGPDPDFKLTIDIKKINLNWDGAMEFLPGKQYDKIPLL
jgi:hypothetical protein